MSIRVAVIQFPGSNDDRDALWSLNALGADASLENHGSVVDPYRDVVGVDPVVRREV